MMLCLHNIVDGPVIDQGDIYIYAYSLPWCVFPTSLFLLLHLHDAAQSHIFPPIIHFSTVLFIPSHQPSSKSQALRVGVLALSFISQQHLLCHKSRRSHLVHPLNNGNVQTVGR